MADGSNPARQVGSMDKSPVSRFIGRVIVPLGVGATVVVLAMLWLVATPPLAVRHAQLPEFLVIGGEPVLRFPSGAMAVRLMRLPDEYRAYLALLDCRSRLGVQAERVLVRVVRSSPRPEYEVILQLSDNILTAIPEVEHMRSTGYVEKGATAFRVEPKTITRWREETDLLAAVYEPLRVNVRTRFRTVPAVRDLAQGDPFVSFAIFSSEAYGIPLAFFSDAVKARGNFLDSAGNIRGARWSQLAGPDDLVLARRPGRVLVVLRTAPGSRLTEQAARDGYAAYTRYANLRRRLPPELQPFSDLGAELSTGMLTVYCGSLMRELVDGFGGDVGRALNAYRAEAEDPNVRQNPGVRRLAMYIKHALQQAAAVARITAQEP